MLEGEIEVVLVVEGIAEVFVEGTAEEGEVGDFYPIPALCVDEAVIGCEVVQPDGGVVFFPFCETVQMMENHWYLFHGASFFSGG